MQSHFLKLELKQPFLCNFIYFLYVFQIDFLLKADTCKKQKRLSVKKAFEEDSRSII